MTSAAPVRASRRRKPATPIVAIAGSARRVDLTVRSTNMLNRERQGWQAEAWSFYDEVPEVKYTVRHIGSAMAKLRLVAAWDDPADNRDPIPLFDDDGVMLDEADGLTPALAESAVAEIARLDAHTDGGIPVLLEAMNHQFEIVGECWMVGYGPTAVDMERWEIRSIDEVDTRNSVVYIRDSTSQKHAAQRALDPAVDTIIRLWINHPHFRNNPDSPMRAAMGDCRALVGLSNEIIAATNSQASAGVLLVPNEIDDGTTDLTDGEGDDEDPFVTELENALIEPIIDPESARAVAPIVIRGPALALAEMRHMSFGRDRTETLDAAVEARVLRLARAMNMPVEIVTGHMATTFANAETIEQNKWDDHYEPRARLITALLTSVFLRPNLIDSGFAPELVSKVRIWGDGTALIRQPDVEKNAGEAHKALAISDAAYRSAVGFGDQAAPDEEELLRRMSMSSPALTGDLTLQLLQVMLADRIGVDLTPTVIADISKNTPADVASQPVAASVAASTVDATVTAAVSEPSDVGRRLMEIDRDLRTRLIVAADQTVGRALDRAGSKLRTSKKVRGLVAATVPAREVAATLGMSGMTAAGVTPDTLLDGAFDGLESTWTTWAEQAANDTLDTLERLIGELPNRPELLARYEEGAKAGWTHLVESLHQFTAGQLLGETVVTVGEFVPTQIVPPGLIRQTLSVSGGTAELAGSPEAGAWVSFTPDGRPAGGIATGDRTMAVARDGGATVEAFVWVYGPAARLTPFQPHLDLDGRTFANFDDPILANVSDWPPSAFYLPGDHGGCSCDASPVMIAPPARTGISAAATIPETTVDLIEEKI